MIRPVRPKREWLLITQALLESLTGGSGVEDSSETFKALEELKQRGLIDIKQIGDKTYLKVCNG